MSRSKSRKTRKGRALLVVLTVLLVIVGLATAGALAAVVATASFARGHTIAPNVRVGGVLAEGMTAAQAQAALEREFVPRLPAEITLTYPTVEEAVTFNRPAPRDDQQAAMVPAPSTSCRPIPG